MTPGYRSILTLFAVCFLCVIACAAYPVSILWVDNIEVGQTHPAYLEGSPDTNNPTEIWFTITYNSTLVELSGPVFTDDPDHSRSASVERLANNTIQVKVRGTGQDFDHFADISFTGLSPGPAVVTIAYQRYGYYEGTTFIDQIIHANSEDDSFRVYRPYAEVTAPCRIEAENYDYGPNGYAYYDTTPGNTGGAYRSDDVDISQMPGGGYNIGYVADGEWLTYTVSSPPGYVDNQFNANISLRIASWKDGCKIKISNGYRETTIPVPNTHDQWISVEDSLYFGNDQVSTVKVQFIGSGQIFDYLEFVERAPDPAFGIGNYDSYPPSTVEFFDGSGNLPTGWAWSFGDGATSTLQYSTHIYSQPGRYPVQLKVTNDIGSASLTKYVYILSNLSSHPRKLFTLENFDPSNPWAYMQSPWKNKILYNDNGLHVFDIDTNSVSDINTSTNAVSFDMEGNWIVWASGYGYSTFSTPSNIYLHNIQTGQETRLTSSYNASNPSISGDRIVYQDRRNGSYDIILYNLTTRTESVICSESHDQIFPVIDGDTVAWQDYRLGHTRRRSGSDEQEPTSNIYLYSLTSGTGRLISSIDTNQESPALSGHRVIWLDGRKDRTMGDSGAHIYYFMDIYMFDINTNTESVLKEDYADFSSFSSLAISGDWAAWLNNYNSVVGIVNLETDQEYAIENAVSPAIAGSTILYMINGDVFQLPLITPGAVPGGSGTPLDLNSDGKYEDVNGNGRADFADVVLYFNQMSWIAANEPVEGFDYNGNDRIDFADVVWLFTNL